LLNRAQVAQLQGVALIEVDIGAVLAAMMIDLRRFERFLMADGPGEQLGPLGLGQEVE
jgi:hypothetical protein